MAPDVQQAVADIWPKISSETLYELSDYKSYQSCFLSLFGFGLDGVDYDEDIEIEIDMPSSN
jgi:enoyl-[acyl-carrier protein] reductase/trans-2-enoyl-CoA reductase (NAD+)